MARVFIKSYGCCANQNNGELMAGILEKEGHSLVGSPKESDVILINSCIVKSSTESRVRHAIGEAVKSGKRLIIAGCMPEAECKACRKIAPDASLVNTFHITKIADAAKSAEKGEIIELLGKRKEAKNCLPVIRKKEKAANIQISEGCLNSCSFCIVRKAKGALRSFPKEEIIEDVEKAVGEGCTSINITSQDNATYGLDRGRQELIPLLKELVAIEGNFEIRVGMMNPEHALPMMEGLVEVFKSQKIRKFIHIPVQSGSDKVLKGMNRNYKVGDFKKLVKAFRTDVKGIVVSTDVIAGYPIEAEEDFQQTIELIKKIRPEVLNISRFGPRPGTLAAKLKQLPSQEVKRRSRILTLLFQGQRRKV